MVYVPDDAPPFAVYSSPYGGLGLKTKSYAKARARIEGLLDIGTETLHRLAELSVAEPASRALAEALHGPLSPDTASIGGGAERTELGALVAAHGHAHDALAGEAWRLFGEPNKAGVRQRREGKIYTTFVVWNWATEDRTKTTAAMDAWHAFVVANDQAMYDDYSTLVEVRCIWETRLMVGRKVVAPPYPASQIHASLRGRRSSAFLDVVLPHESATDAFLADYQAVNRALGMTMPMTGYKLCAAKKKGSGRVYKRLPGL